MEQEIKRCVESIENIAKMRYYYVIMKNYTWDDHKKELMQNAAFKRAYDSLEIEYAIASALIDARAKRGLSQAQEAKKMKTTQSVISRVESARTTPTVSFLKRLSVALNLPLHISLG